MPFIKGDIVSLDFENPSSGNYEKHPAIIISCVEVYNHDKCYVCVMMTSNGASDRFTFMLDDTMLDKPNNKSNSQVRCHLITYVREAHIHPSIPYNKLKPHAMDRLLERINVSVFDN